MVVVVVVVVGAVVVVVGGTVVVGTVVVVVVVVPVGLPLEPSFAANAGAPITTLATSNSAVETAKLRLRLRLALSRTPLFPHR
jgi:hypothetical protein